MNALVMLAWTLPALAAVGALLVGCGLLVDPRGPRPRHRRDWRSEAGSLAVGVGWGVVLSAPLWLLLVAGAWWLGVLS